MKSVIAYYDKSFIYLILVSGKQLESRIVIFKTSIKKSIYSFKYL